MINFIEKVKALDPLSGITIPTTDPTGNAVKKTSFDFNYVNTTLQSVIAMTLNIVGYLSALFFLYGAFMYIISYGNEAKAGKAKQTMTWAILGLGIAILARLFVAVIANEFSSNPNNANSLNEVTSQTTSP